MARSLKSKRRKKLNAIKRERYGKKEMIRLKNMLGLPTEESTGIAVKKESTISEIANVVNFKEVKTLQDPAGETPVDDEIEEIRMKRLHKIRTSYRPDARIKGSRSSKRLKYSISGAGADQMEHDQQRHYNETTLRDQYGNYPPWMNQRTVIKLAKENKKRKRLEKRQKNKPRRRGRKSDDDNNTVTENEVAGLVEAIMGLEKFGVSTGTSK